MAPGTRTSQQTERGARQRSGSGAPRTGAPGRRSLTGRRLLVAGLALLALSAAVVWVLYGSGLLRLTRVTATGADVLTQRQVVRAAQAPLGTPLVSVDTDALAARVRRRLPRVDSVTVTRSWPHTLEVHVAERQPVLVMKKGAKFEEVDADGVRFDTVGNAPRGALLLEFTPAKGAVSERFTTTRLLREAAAVRASLPSGIAGQTLSMRLRSYDAVSLSLTGGRTVMWGSEEDAAAKARALTALLKAVPGARHFDVSAPTAPAASGS
jgi:cell division protein FtsQ